MPTIYEVAALVGICLAVALLVQFVKLVIGWRWPHWRDGRARRPFFRGLALFLGTVIGVASLPVDFVPGLHSSILGLVCGGLSEYVYRLIRPWLTDQFQGRRAPGRSLVPPPDGGDDA